MDAQIVSDLAKLLPIMRDLKVSHLKIEGFEVSFHAPVGAPSPNVRSSLEACGVAALEAREPQKEEKPQQAPEKPIETVRVEDVVVPQGLSEELKFDQILHWSAPVDEGPTALTDDQTITEPMQVQSEGLTNG